MPSPEPQTSHPNNQFQSTRISNSPQIQYGYAAPHPPCRGLAHSPPAPYAFHPNTPATPPHTSPSPYTD
ncbi:uncharacterized protein K444DRAFT_611243 [Hyaloscypha bicolor E]|uniref:Uncharacterized protein n=1 Tax=Hyaloscypha bicolor E TaxID=1095630 RepID=A0A2J6TG93_9HELO|nr:uncharacterized protein K444DRAFT_611243 [Hyaloscypha bicolor E]PMD62033.1 hypothetical protein K444DRAFT_611243 [Hyaloscypha bicolor E]